MARGIADIQNRPCITRRVVVTEPHFAYVAVRRPDAKHRKRDYRRAPEATVHPKAEHA
jgi:hypothetical protein